MEAHKEAVVAIVKTSPAWVAVSMGHVLDNITLAACASIAAIIYSSVQTYISIMRYRRGK